MKLREIVEKLHLTHVYGELDIDVKRGCSGDLLSEIMRSCKSDSIWITVQSHVNIVAVAVVVGIRAIVLCNGYDYDQDTFEKAKREGITLLRTEKDPFEVAGKIYQLMEGA